MLKNIIKTCSQNTKSECSHGFIEIARTRVIQVENLNFCLQIMICKFTNLMYDLKHL